MADGVIQLRQFVRCICEFVRWYLAEYDCRYRYRGWHHDWRFIRTRGESMEWEAVIYK
jgi:hypothetical protein